MLRNDLITWLSQQDNNTVVVDVGGRRADIDGVNSEDGCVVLRLAVDGPESDEVPSDGEHVSSAS